MRKKSHRLSSGRGSRSKGGFLGHEHTLKHLHSTEVWQPRLAVRRGLVEGAPPAGGSVERAQTAIRKILHTQTVAPLSADVQSAVTETINAYAA